MSLGAWRTSRRYKPSILCSAAALSLSRPRSILQTTYTARGPAGKPARTSAHVRATEHAPWLARCAKAVGAVSQSQPLSFPAPRPPGPWASGSRRPCVMTYLLAKTWGRRRAVREREFPRLFVAALVVQSGPRAPPAVGLGLRAAVGASLRSELGRGWRSSLRIQGSLGRSENGDFPEQLYLGV